MARFELNIIVNTPVTITVTAEDEAAAREIGRQIEDNEPGARARHCPGVVWVGGDEVIEVEVEAAE